uniref:Chrysanthemyl diphosphate synthase n=1 Tax=Tanacetum cinerariifolium TaxID=118510 RepID=A0A6L2J337_TANCI|nr:chrysanthemyl diphosphate synthase [Tanacetum cinerariifolium]
MRDEKKRLDHLKQDQTMLVIKRFSEADTKTASKVYTVYGVAGMIRLLANDQLQYTWRSSLLVQTTRGVTLQSTCFFCLVYLPYTKNSEKHFSGKAYYVNLLDLFIEVDFQMVSRKMIDVLITFVREKDLSKYSLSLPRGAGFYGREWGEVMGSRGSGGEGAGSEEEGVAGLVGVGVVYSRFKRRREEDRVPFEKFT